MKVFVTSNYRRVRKLAMISVIEETGLRVRAVSVARGTRIADSRRIAFGASAAGTRTSFSDCSTVMLPKNVPNALGLNTSRAMMGAVGEFTTRKGLITTVYTTPDILNRGRVLRNGGTAYRPNFRRGLLNTR